MTVANSSERYSVPSSTGASVRYEGNAVPLQVRMLDFSATGAGFLMPELPSVGAGVVLSITGETDQLQLSGVIRWAQPRPGGWWRVGCHFTQSIADGFDPGGNAIRPACEIPVQIRCQGAPDERFSGTVINHSHGGVCVRMANSFEPGQSLMFESPDGDAEASFVTRVQWCRTEYGESVLGCQFIRPTGLTSFRTMLPKVETAPAEEEDRSPVLTNDRAVWAGCAIVYGWAAIHLLGLWSA